MRNTRLNKFKKESGNKKSSNPSKFNNNSINSSSYFSNLGKKHIALVHINMLLPECKINHHVFELARHTLPLYELVSV